MKQINMTEYLQNLPKSDRIDKICEDMINDLSLRNICNRFFEYGEIWQNIDKNLEYEIDEDFEQRYLNENFDPMGYLYQIEITFDNCDGDFYTNVYKNILYKSYEQAKSDKESLENLIEFASNFVKNNEIKYDVITDKYILEEILTEDEDEFVNDFDYFSVLSKTIRVEISQLMITDFDKELKQYCDKYLK